MTTCDYCGAIDAHHAWCPIGKIDNLEDRLVDLESQLTGKVDEIDSLRKLASEMESSLQEREFDVHIRVRKSYDKTIADAWRAKVAELEADRDRWKRQSDDWQKRGWEFGRRVDEMKSELEALKAIQSQREEELSKQCVMPAKQANEMQEELARLRSDNDELEASRDELISKRDRLLGVIKDVVDDIESCPDCGICQFGMPGDHADGCVVNSLLEALEES